MKTDLQLTGVVLGVLEFVGWLALIGVLPLAWSLNWATERETALLTTLIAVVSTLSFIALVRIGRAVLVIADRATSQSDQSQDQSRPLQPPTAPEKKQQFSMDYRGHTIVSEGDNVAVAGQTFNDFNEAKRHIDSMLAKSA